MLGYESKEELMAIDIKTQLYFDPSDRESLALLEHKKELDVFPLKKKDGTTLFAEDHGWYITDEKDQILFHEGILRNVTERKKAESQLQNYFEELQELNATKDLFFSIIAHDLKTPFNSIIGFSEVMKNEFHNLDNATIMQYIELIHNISKNTFRLLENLLDWSRMQQGNMPFIPKSMILRELVSEVFELLHENAKRKKITLINSVYESSIIHADVNMIKTVIRNLVSNAVKYTTSGGIIDIFADIENDFIRIHVKDTGIGMNPEDLSNLFKIGKNFSRKGTENEAGTGLGLALCKDFIERHGGKIWVESDKGKGSEFIFSLPC